jgi:hypothetical protein
VEKFRIVCYNEYILANPFSSLNFRLKFKVLAGWSYDIGCTSKREYFSLMHCYALRNKNYCIFASKMSFTRLLKNINLTSYKIGLTSSYVLCLRDLRKLDFDFRFLMSGALSSNFLLNMN